MKPNQITEVYRLARRIIKRIEAVQETDDYRDSVQLGSSLTGGKESAALRRISMELTRALAEMRRP